MFDLFGRATATGVDPELTAARQRPAAHDLEPGALQPARPRPRALRGWRPPWRPDVIARLDATACCRRSPSCSAAPAATPPCSSACRPGCGSPTRTSAPRSTRSSTSAPQRSPREDLEVLGYWDWRDGLRRGFAAHHAGLVPAFKETVEELFVRGLVKAVFATETLALGINMPARTVVLERLTKFNGETHADLTPGEYTQLTGRAGRRGIDVEGHAVVLWGPEVDPARVAGLASTRTYPLRSSFRPSYNMAVNLVGQMGRSGRAPPARVVLRAVPGRPRRARAGQADPPQRADAGRVRPAADLPPRRHPRVRRAAPRSSPTARRELSRQGAQARASAAVAHSLEALRPGDVIRVPSGQRAGLAVVARPGPARCATTRTRSSSPRRAGPAGSRSSTSRWRADVLGHVRVPKHVDHRSPQVRRDLVSSLRALDLPPAQRRRRKAGSGSGEDAEVLRLRAALRAHPCHQCGDREQHMRWAERHARLQRDTDDLRRRIEGRTGSLGRRFDRICRLLDRRGYLAADETTPAGRQLARIWSESRTWSSPSACAPERGTRWSRPNWPPWCRRWCTNRAATSAPSTGCPTTAVRDALATTVRIWARVADDEDELGLTPSREPRDGPGVGAVPVGTRRPARSGARRGGRGRCGAVGGRLRALVQAGARPARAARRRAARPAASPSRSPRAARARRGGRPPRRRRAEHAALNLVSESGI